MFKFFTKSYLNILVQNIYINKQIKFTFFHSNKYSSIILFVIFRIIIVKRKFFPFLGKNKG